jgi:hypothetical protein
LRSGSLSSKPYSFVFSLESCSRMKTSISAALPGCRFPDLGLIKINLRDAQSPTHPANTAGREISGRRSSGRITGNTEVIHVAE